MNNRDIKYYPLTQTNNLLLLAESLTGKIYNNLCILINFEQDDIDWTVMEAAINEAILRFPTTRLRRHDVKEGEKNVVMQYFVEAPETKCVNVSFKSDKKMYKYINKFVKKPFPNDYQDCDLYKINLVKRANGRYSMLLCMYHLLADAYALIKFCEDVIDIYKALKNNTEMPKPFDPILPAYEKFWEYENDEKRNSADFEFWSNFWPSVPTPQYATINGYHDKYAYIPGKKYGNYLNIFNCKANQVNYRVPKELNDRIKDFASQNKISEKILYLTALRTWLSKQTEKTEEFALVDLIANRSKASNTANTSGSFVSSLYFYLDAKNNMTFTEACKHLSSSQYKYLKHSRFNHGKVKELLEKEMHYDKIFDKGWVRGASAFLFTFQPYFVSERDDFKLSFERFTTGKSPIPMYITIMPTDTYTGEMNINYEYTTKNHTENNVAEFHSFLLRFLDKATSNPDLTLEELMEV